MKKVILLIIPFFSISNLFSQIQIVERTHTDVTLIGKISHTAAYQTHGLNRKLPTVDPLKISGNPNSNSYILDKNGKNLIRKEANASYNSVAVRVMSWAKEEFSASLLHFKDRDKYLLTFENSSYNYQRESFWLSEQTKYELHQLIKGELEKKIKFKNIEVLLDNDVVLVLSINKKKVNFNFWDGSEWITSYWYRLFKINNLFGEV